MAAGWLSAVKSPKNGTQEREATSPPRLMVSPALGGKRESEAPSHLARLACLPFLPLARQDPGIRDFPVSLNSMLISTKRLCSCSSLFLEDSAHTPPNDWLILLKVSPEILTFWKWEFHQPKVASPAQSCISSHSTKHYHIARISKWCITVYYLEVICFLPWLKHNYHKGGNPWFIHHGTSCT